MAGTTMPPSPIARCDRFFCNDLSPIRRFPFAKYACSIDTRKESRSNPSALTDLGLIRPFHADKHSKSPRIRPSKSRRTSLGDCRVRLGHKVQAFPLRCPRKLLNSHRASETSFSKRAASYGQRCRLSARCIPAKSVVNLLFSDFDCRAHLRFTSRSGASLRNDNS
jgi:hypothetical protein